MNMEKELKWKADLPLLLKEILEYNKWMVGIKLCSDYIKNSI